LGIITDEENDAVREIGIVRLRCGNEQISGRELLGIWGGGEGQERREPEKWGEIIHSKGVGASGFFLRAVTHFSRNFGELMAKGEDWAELVFVRHSGSEYRGRSGADTARAVN
jgi:hypothetical protein